MKLWKLHSDGESSVAKRPVAVKIGYTISAMKLWGRWFRMAGGIRLIRLVKDRGEIEVQPMCLALGMRGTLCRLVEL